MKTLSTLLLAVLLSGSLCSLSCKKEDNDPQTCNYANELQDEVNAITDALNVYTTNPTTENCNAYKSSLQTYINQLEKYADCATLAGHGAEIQSYIDQSQASIDAIQC